MRARWETVKQREKERERERERETETERKRNVHDYYLVNPHGPTGRNQTPDILRGQRRLDVPSCLYLIKYPTLTNDRPTLVQLSTTEQFEDYAF